MWKNENTSSDGSPCKISTTQVPSSLSPNKGKRPQASWSLADLVPLIKKSKVDNEVTLKILLPNETHFKFKADAAQIHSVKILLDLVKEKALDEQLETPGSVTSRPVEWRAATKLENVAPGKDSKELKDASLVKMMSAAKRSSTITVLVNDGREDCSYRDPGMWNVTPKPEMLGRLPQGYTLETALAEHIDNAIQAVFNNDPGCRRLVRVNLSPDRIVIFDTGPGMDVNENGENCIKNWGTVGASTNRVVHCNAIGGTAPYMTPFLGKYGVGGVTAGFHLGGCMDVSSTTRESNKVGGLRIELCELLQRSRGESPEDSQQGIWRALGSFRHMTKEEKTMSPHGSFTKVVITKLKPKYCIGDDTQDAAWEVENVRQLLKDIYYPYIQTEEGSSRRTIFPLEFEVNGKNLTEVEDCETAISNLHTCNGEAFVFTIQMLTNRVDRGDKRKARKFIEGANARISCQYYPSLKGKEELETVVEELHLLRPKDRPQSFETINRVLVRWLGRLLPEVKWVFPFMQPSVKEDRGLQTWAKRVRAFVDTDAGFHPVQSKTDLDRGQPFVDALKNIGGSLDKAKEDGVQISISHGHKKVTPSKLANLYLKWLTESHNNFDEELVIADDDDVTYIVKHSGNCFKNLGLGNSQSIVFHTHMKDSTNDWKVDELNPICLKIIKGPGLKADKYVTLEYFFHDVATDDRGVRVNFLCRGIEVDASEGCKITKLPDGNLGFELSHSQWFPATVLNTAKRLDFDASRKEKEKILNKLPSKIEVLNDEETNTFESCEAFPGDGTKFEAGFSLPKEFIAVIRPRKGSGAKFKQGWIFPDPMEIKLTVTHCSCSNDHTREVCSVVRRSTTKNGVKGLYVFNIESSELSQLVKKGTYTFRFTLESEKYKDVRSAVSLIEISPSAMTAKWTFCNHPVHCMLSDHEKLEDDVQPIVIRLKEPIKQVFFLQKYDQYGNNQAFETPLELDLSGVSSKGYSLNMHAKVQSSIVAGTEERQRLLVKGFRFASGSLKQLGSVNEALLQASIAEEQLANIKCTVLPGVLENVEVTSSEPPVLIESMSFEKSLKPGEVIRKLTVQVGTHARAISGSLEGLDCCMNKMEKGQTLRVFLDGVEFQDDCGSDRVVDENGMLQLGGLIKVTCLYNSTGSIAFYSDTKLISLITFKTVTRRLHVDQVPVEAYVGRKLEGISVKVVDECDNVDSSVGLDQSITLDWQPGVMYPFIKGECVLPSFQMPEKPGPWRGNISFSADASLCVTLMVELKLSTASSLGPATSDKDILTAECGKKIIFPFAVYDDHQKPTRLTDSQKESININFEPNEDGNDHHAVFRSITVKHKEAKMSMVDGNYEAHITVSGSAGMYMMTLTDKSLTLDGKVQAVCRLRHGPVSQLVLARSDGILFQEYEDSDEGPLPIIEVKRGINPMPELTVILLDSGYNVCSSCSGRTLKVRLLELPLLKITEISRGVGKLKCSDLQTHVGSFQVLIELERSAEELCFLKEHTSEITPLQAHFSLRVHPGNYPSLLRLPDSDPISVSLTNEAIQYLPPMSILFESADALRLQSRLKVVVKLLDDRCAIPSDPKEYFGQLMESCDTVDSRTRLNQDQGLSSYPVRYDFKQVCTPSQADTYRMEFFAVGGDVASPHRILIVRHGPPNRILITERAAGREISIVKVKIVDAHSNLCESVGGLQLNLNLTLRRSFTGPSLVGLSPCTISSKCTALVEEGHGDFGAFQVTQGIPGIYTLDVNSVHGEGEMDLKPLITKVYAIKGNINQSLVQLLEQNRDSKAIYDCERRIAECKKMIQFKQAEIQSFENTKKNLEVELMSQEFERNNLIEKRQVENDAAILDAEKEHPVRNYLSVVQDLRLAARNSAPLAFWESLTSRTLSLQQRTDFVGLVVMLARVENDCLNRMLAEYLGHGALLLIVTRTQRAIDELEVLDAFGEVDENIGLHGFARSRGYSISSTCDALALMDTRPYKPARGPAVNIQHCQKILNIDPPLLPSHQVPEGFLGYAVNLVYLNSEHLQMRVQTRSQGEVGLRESLFFHLLKTLQVYDSQRNMVSAKENLKQFSGGAISLDGGLIKPNGRQRLGKRRNDIPIRFGLVPYEERLLMGSIIPPACVAIERQRMGLVIDSRIAYIKHNLSSLIPTMDQGILELEELKRTLNRDEKQQQVAQESSKSSESHIVELQKAAGNAAQMEAAKNSGTRNTNKPNS